MTAVVPNVHYDETHQLRVITTAVYAPPSDNRTSTSDTINSVTDSTPESIHWDATP